MSLPNTLTPSTARIGELLRTLFPLPRTLVSDGFDQSLAVLRKTLPLEILEVPSGAAVWDWTVPNAWNVVEAWIATEDGTRLVDYDGSNLRLSAYSLGFDGVVSRDELMAHLAYSKLLPAAIPYNTLYYSRGWQFNVTGEEYRTLFTADRYRVRIVVDEKPGTLKIGELLLKGKTEQEIVISTYMCHPSMANDNLSGVVAAVELFTLLSQLPDRHYSYRLLVLPETVGAVAYLATRKDLDRVLGGYVVYICGDSGKLHYKKSYRGNSVVDAAATHALQGGRFRGEVRNFEPFGSDERQYNAPGVRLDVGAITRSPPSEFPEYHTSADNLDFISTNALAETVSFLLEAIGLLEMNRRYRNLYRGEPFFSRHGIRYPTFHNTDNYLGAFNFKRIAYEIDGTQDVFAIADKLGIPVDEVSAVVRQFAEKNLVELIG